MFAYEVINQQHQCFSNYVRYIQMQRYYLININPLVPSAHKSVRIAKISILKLEGIIKKISYERRDYESVDENSLSEALSRKTTKRRIQALKG